MGRLPAWVMGLALVVPIGVLADEVHFEGELIRVTDSPAFEFQPRIDGDIVVFTTMATSAGDIAYVDLADMSYHPVTNDSAAQHLQDVSGHRITYTDAGGGSNEIMIHDLSAGTTEAVTDAEGSRRSSAIDGDVVVYVHQPPSGASGIWATDLAAGATLIVTDNDLAEDRPTVSGRIVAFERNDPAEGRRIVLHDLDSGVELVPVPDAADQRRPHLDGGRLVFDAVVDGRPVRDLVVVDLATGAVNHLALDGNQTFARISESWLAFDDDGLGSSDIVVLHLPTGFFHRITSPDTSDFLNDIDGNRVVFTSNAAGSFDIWMFEFETDLQDAEDPDLPDPGEPLAECEGDPPAVGAPIFEATAVREAEAPVVETHAFAHPGGGDVFVVVDTGGCASAWATLNGEILFEPDDLDGELECLFGVVTVEEENVLELSVRGQPGCEITIGFHPVAAESTGFTGVASDDIGSLSCESVSGAAWLASALILFGLLFGGRTPRPVPVRLRRRR
jgi:Tol biopolymer transport system component